LRFKIKDPPAGVDKPFGIEYSQAMRRTRKPGPVDIVILLGAFVNLVVITLLVALWLSGG